MNDYTYSLIIASIASSILCFMVSGLLYDISKHPNKCEQTDRYECLDKCGCMWCYTTSTNDTFESNFCIRSDSNICDKMITARATDCEGSFIGFYITAAISCIMVIIVISMIINVLIKECIRRQSNKLKDVVATAL